MESKSLNRGLGAAKAAKQTSSCASSANVLSPPIAANATLTLNTAECVRLGRVVIVCSISSPYQGINGSRFST